VPRSRLFNVAAATTSIRRRRAQTSHSLATATLVLHLVHRMTLSALQTQSSQTLHAMVWTIPQSAKLGERLRVGSVNGMAGSA